jgi:hypothetical protein
MLISFLDESSEPSLIHLLHSDLTCDHRARLNTTYTKEARGQQRAPTYLGSKDGKLGSSRAYRKQFHQSQPQSPHHHKEQPL